MPTSPATPEDVAQWMHDEFTTTGELSQYDAAEGIESRFGSGFTHPNESGNRAIDRKVLKAFRGLTETDAVWEPGDLCWRRRVPSDPLGKRTAE
jgi:hypothetical protein